MCGFSLGSVRVWRWKRSLKGQRRSATVTLLAFAGFGLVCGLVSAAVLWWYASQPFTIYTFSYRPHDLESTQIEKVSVYRFITGLLIGGPIFGTAVGRSF